MQKDKELKYTEYIAKQDKRIAELKQQNEQLYNDGLSGIPRAKVQLLYDWLLNQDKKGRENPYEILNSACNKLKELLGTGEAGEKEK